MTWLVTGAAGFVGCNLLERMATRGIAAIALDTREVPVRVSAAFDASALTAVQGDVCDVALLSRLMREHSVTTVIHAAAITPGIERERTGLYQVVSVNLSGTAAALQAAVQTGVQRFILVSSVAVFGPGVPDGEIIEEDRPLAPVALYPITKATSEMIARRVAQVSGLPIVIGRLGVVFGRHEAETGVRDLLSPFYHATRRAMAGGHFTLPRPARRNWQYATDAADALIALAQKPSLGHDTYNLGPSHVWTVQDWCGMLAQRFGSFTHEIGDVEGASIGLHNPSDGGLLSWQRYEDEMAPGARITPQAAFDDYMGWLAGKD